MPTPTLYDEGTSAAPLAGEKRRGGGLAEPAAPVRGRLATLALPEHVIPLAIVLAVVAVFAVGLRNEFVQWDDPSNLVENPHFRGLAPSNVAWMFTTTLMGHYIPVTWLSFGLDYVLWGMEPAGYHFTNLLLHAANAVLVYWVSKRLLAAARPGASPTALRAGAAVAALFFAIHPLRAESVAWATERRDVLSGLLFLTSVLTYLRAAGANGARRRRLLAGSVAAFALALLAKSIVMTLPLLLIVLDWYPLRRLSAAPATWRTPQTRRTLLEKLPFGAVAVAGAAVSYWAVAHHDYFTPAAKYPLPSRVAMALYSMVFYVSKTILPTDLSPLYELPVRINPLDSEFVLAAVAVALVSVSLVALAGRWPAGLAACAWYAIVLAPVGGLVHAGFQLAHDRYSYLSCLGFAVLFGGEAALRRATAKFPTEKGMLNNLGMALHQQGRFEEAVPFLRRAVALNERNVVVRANLARALAGLGRYDEALAEFRSAAEEQPFAVEPRIGLVLVYRDMGNVVEMRKQLTILRQLHPDAAREIVARHDL